MPSAKRLGIIGGGQLGMMLTEASRALPDYISGVTVLDPVPGCPASQAGAEQLVGGFADEDAIKKLAAKCDIITYEIESGNADMLEKVGRMAAIRPDPGTLRTIQDKLVQKRFLQKHGIPVGEFAAADSAAEAEEAIVRFGSPALLKARRGGYDGRGNMVTESGGAHRAFERFEAGLYVEKKIDFEMEVSVIAARSTRGQIATYPLVENIHHNNILEMSIAPARIGGKIARRAEQVAHQSMERFGGAGVFGIEMFVSRDEQILVNEIAPRVHNSGHHTLHSCKTSQFEQHLRAILGLELGPTRLLCNAVMYNILGPRGFTGRYAPISLSEPDAHLKMYGKRESRPQRKLGHVNITSDGSMADLIRRAAKLRALTTPVKTP